MKPIKLFVPLVLVASMTVIPLLAQHTVYTNPVVQKAKYFRKTKPLREMKQIAPGERDRSWKDNVIRNEQNVKSARCKQLDTIPDPVVQHQMGQYCGRSISQNFDGVSNVNGVYPPDTEGDIGPNHYFQMINLSFAIYDKNGTLLYGPVDNSTLWNGFIGPWTGTNDGDPVVLYDELADRWLASQFAINTSNGTYWELIAISETSDPTGSYYQYAYQFPAFNDYPKLSVWPDGYYASFNLFGSYNRVAAAAFERDLMLVGNPSAVMVLFDLPYGSDPFSMLPSDFDGTPPPAGTPNYFAYFNDDAWGYPYDEIRIWEFDVDWANTANSTFSEVLSLQTAPFSYDICYAYRERCINQPGTSRKLEAISDRLMYRLQYRNFGTHEVLVTNHTVNAGSGVAGVRWYEIRDSHNGNGFQIYQQGTYSPDNNHRWMGSVAMDAFGNIAVGYSVPSSSVYPSIRYTGRLAADPLGQLTLAEDEIMAGSGSQTGSGCRWGDYSMMALDPVDTATFWYTTEYLQTTGTAPWKTRIASFYFQSPLPSVYAGVDLSTCEYTPVQMNPTVSNQSSILWTSQGDGSFDNPTFLNANYTPGTGDLTIGSVDLIITAYAIPPLTDSVSDTTNLSVIIHPVAFAGNDTTICENLSFTTQAIASNADSVLWVTNGDGTFNDSTSISAIYYPGPLDISNGSVQLDLTAYSIAPCTGDSLDSMILYFQLLPGANAGNNDTICANETCQLSGSASNYNSLLWSTSGDGVFNNDTILDPTYTPGANDISNGSATLTLTAFAIGPCVIDSLDSMLLTIDSLQLVNAGDDQIILHGTTTTLSGTVSGGSGSFSYLWTPQNLVVNPTSLTTETFNLYSTTIFTLTATDSITGCENSDDVTITVDGNPLAAQATASPSFICVGDSSQLDVIPSGGSGSYTYSWISDPPGFTSNLQNPVVYPVVNTTYTVTVDDGYNTVNSSVEVEVQEPSLANAGTDATICHNESITLSGTAVNYSSTLWTSSGDGNFDDPALLNATYTPGSNDISNGGVTLTLTAEPINPCTVASSDEIYITIVICPGISESNQSKPNFQIHPNPNKGEFELIVTGLNCLKLQVSIIDLTGSELYQKEFITYDGKLSRSLNLTNLKQGLYLVQLKCADNLITQKLVIW
jgi:hypothetical protein